MISAPERFDNTWRIEWGGILNEVWSSVNSFFKWRFRSCCRHCCLSSLLLRMWWFRLQARQILSNWQFWMCFLLVVKETRLLWFDWLAQNEASLLNQFESTWKRLQWIVRRISRQWWNLPLLGKISESVVNFDCKDEILWCEYSNETSSSVLLLSVMWYLVFWKWNFELFLKFYFDHCATFTQDSIITCILK